MSVATYTYDSKVGLHETGVTVHHHVDGAYPTEIWVGIRSGLSSSHAILSLEDAENMAAALLESVAALREMAAKEAA